MKNSNESPMVFKFDTNNAMRSLLVENQPWFVANDICKVLELKDTRSALRTLDDDEKLSGKIRQSGQHRKMWLVNESGLYALIMRSSKPQARRFRKWVTSEVLPTIRRQGSYSFKSRSEKLQASYVERGYYKELTDTVDAAKLVCGSQNQLAERLGVTAAVLTNLHKRPWLVSEDMQQGLLTGCKNIVARQGKYDTEALENLLKIDQKDVRMKLYEKMQKGGLL